MEQQYVGENVHGDPRYHGEDQPAQKAQPAIVLGGTLAAAFLLGGIAIAAAVKSRSGQARPADPAP